MVEAVLGISGLCLTFGSVDLASMSASVAWSAFGYPTQAAQAYRGALAKAPDNEAAMLGLGSAMIESGDVEVGVRALAQAAPMVNTSKAYNRLGVAQTLAGQFEKA
ncbi:tetratricopeptide repeat protein [Mesorhizobium sp. ORM8.1]